MSDNIFGLLRSDIHGKQKLTELVGTECTTYARLAKDLEEYDASLNLRQHLISGSSIADKKCCVYEFPTYELVKSIFKIAQYADVKFYNEMFGGSGLLARAVANYNTHNSDFKFSKINCTDGNYAWDTIGYKFYDVGQKCFYDTVTSFNSVPQSVKHDYRKSMFVFSWMPYEHEPHIRRFLSTLKPKCLVVIGDHIINDKPTTYKQIKIHIKQMCYRDNAGNIIHESESDCTSHSYINLFIRTSGDISADIIGTELLLRPFKVSLKTIVEDMKHDDPKKHTLYTYMSANPAILPDIFTKMCDAKITCIPACVKTIEDLHAYILIAETLKINPEKYIADNAHLRKLTHCMNEYMFCSDDQYEKGIKDGTIPDWIQKESVLKYIIYEHLCDEKTVIFTE